MKAIYIIFTLFFIGIGNLSAQIIFQKRFLTTTDDRAASMRMGDNKYLISGSRLSVISSDGDELLSIDDEAKRGSFLTQGRFVTATNSYFGSPSSSVAHLVWYDKDGVEERAERIDDAVWRNYVEDIIPLDNGYFAYSGRHSTVAGSGAILRKIDSLGNQIWESRWNSGVWIATYAEQIFQVDTFLYVIGRANDRSAGHGLMRDMFVTQHRLSTGEQIGDVVVSSDSIHDPTDLHILNESTVLLLGNNNSDTQSSGSRGTLSKIDLSGSIVWTNFYSSPFIEQFQGIEVAPLEGYLILGNRKAIQSDSIFTFVKKIDDEGIEVWEYTFPNMDVQQEGVELIRESNSVYTIGGHVGNGESKDYYFQKFDITNLADSSFVGSNEITTQADHQIKLYPNPVSKQLTIDVSTDETSTVIFKIFDATGRRLTTGTFALPTISLNVEMLSSGSYFVSLQFTDHLEVRRFVVL